MQIKDIAELKTILDHVVPGSTTVSLNVVGIDKEHVTLSASKTILLKVEVSDLDKDLGVGDIVTFEKADGKITSVAKGEKPVEVKSAKSSPRKSCNSMAELRQARGY